MLCGRRRPISDGQRGKAVGRFGILLRPKGVGQSGQSLPHSGGFDLQG